MIGENLRKIRESKKLGVNQLARISGVNASYISNLENNKRKNPSMETLHKLADALGLSVNEFFDDENNKDQNTDIKDIKDIKANKLTEDKDIDTIAAHLEGKNLTPQKIKLLEQYIDALFDDEDFDD